MKSSEKKEKLIITRNLSYTVFKTDGNYLTLTELQELTYKEIMKEKELIVVLTVKSPTEKEQKKYKVLNQEPQTYIYYVSDLEQKSIKSSVETITQFRYKIIGERKLYSNIVKEKNKKTTKTPTKKPETIYSKYINEDIKEIDLTKQTLISWMGNKRKFTNTIQDFINECNLDKTKFHIDCFTGGGGSVFPQIEQISNLSENIVINDINPLITNMFQQIKDNPNAVIEKMTEIKDEFQSLLPDELKNLSNIQKTTLVKKGFVTDDENVDSELKEFKKEYQYLKQYYKENIVGKLNDDNTDNITKCVCLIYNLRLTTNSMLQYKKDSNKINDKNYSWDFLTDKNTATKIELVKYYNYLLNEYNVTIENLDVFELLRKYKDYSKDTKLLLDPPYVSTDVDYGTSNVNSFQIKLLESVKDFKYVIYHNEECEELHNVIDIDTFDNYTTFERPNIQTGGLEFLSFQHNT